MMLAVDDIQGMILGGFNTDYQTLLALTLIDVAQAQSALAWLAQLEAEITTTAMVRQTRVDMKAGTAIPPYWLGVAVGTQIVDLLQDLYLLDSAFNGGMVKRSASILGDFTDPDNWALGGPADPIDVLLIIGSNNQLSVEGAADELISRAEVAGFRSTYRETGARLVDDREHFGFRDGISQPKVIGFDDGGTLGAGNFVFGYVSDPGGPIILPARDARGLAPNGSLLVLRRLKQDVASFRNFCEQEAQRIQHQWPGLTADRLAALIVGRWPSGTPVRNVTTQDPGDNPPGNDFDFRDDPDGNHCPFAAHIRKVNPREGARDEVNIPRIIRRGIPFGRPDEEDRGLIFIAFQTAIPNQFEKLTRKWMNGAISPNPGNDLLVGRSRSERTMEIMSPNGPVKISDGGRQWITPTGGAYLFAPSRSALAKFGDPPSASLLWHVQTLFKKNFDRVTRIMSSTVGLN